MNCLHCNKETSNPKYCSRSCAAKESNKNPKRKKTKICKSSNCKEKIYSNYTYCTSCWKEKDFIRNVPLGKVVYKKHHKSSAFALIRGRARTIMKDVKCCQSCGYDKHVEVCHIKPISDFSDETFISVINDRNNLIVLCRNCHWEFDHSLLSLKEITSS